MLKYRKDIDGLRAIAVLLVILFHYNTPLFERGFIGVDIFFVISGYLIGSIILSGLESNSFSFKEFYARRIRRILPALYNVILAAILFSVFFLDSLFLKESARSAMSSVLFVSNIFFYQTTGGYLTGDNGSNLFLHTWSLSLEEQYYIFFPVFIWCIYRYARKHLVHFVAGLLLLSLGLSIVFTKGHPVFSFYLPFTRIWEFLAGVILVKLNFSRLKPAYREVFSLLGILLIIVGLCNFNNASGFPGYAAIFPIAGAALIIMTGKEQPAIINRILSFPALVFIGKISYSLYLWHWPIKVFASYIMPGPLQFTDILILGIITLLLSILSLRFIEQPFRRMGTPQRKKVFITAGLSSAVILGGLWLIITKNGFPERSESNKLLVELQETDTWPTIWSYHGKTLSIDSTKQLPIIGNKNAEPDLLLWGDSHAGMQLPGYEAACIEKGKSSYVAITVGDAPVMPLGRQGYNPGLDRINSAILQFIADHPTIKKIFLSGRWTKAREASESTGDNNYHFDKELRYIIDTLAKMNRAVIIIGPTPELQYTPQQYLAEEKFSGKPINSLTSSVDQFLQQHKRTSDFFQTLNNYPNSQVLNIYPAFYADQKLLLKDGGHLLFTDLHHLSKWGSLKLKESFFKEF
jgi:peptidoglycan/LPS O-acetylase OafA/YrhL